MVMVRFGINPIVWSNDDLQALGGETPLEVCLAEARTAGYAGIELGHKFPREAKKLAPILSQHQLALVSGWHSGHLGKLSIDDELRALAPHADLLAACGAGVLIYAECTGTVHPRIDAPLLDRPQLDAAGWKRLAAGLERVAAALAPKKLRIAYHHHMGTVVQTEDEIDQLMQSTPESVGLLLDTGHLTFAGGDPKRVAEKWAKRITHVHCKDVRREVLDSLDHTASFLDAVVAGAFTVPGDGAIDFEPVFAVRKRAGYGGWLVVEADQDPAKAPPLEYATKGLAYLRDRAARVKLAG
jgi:inosose dehydratase